MRKMSAREVKKKATVFLGRGACWIRSFPERLVIATVDRLFERNWRTPTVTTPSAATLENIDSFLIRAGIKNGDTVFVHSSWLHLNSGSFAPHQLIRMLLGLVGERGTLAMPAFPPYSMQKEGAVFDVKKTPSGGGMIADLFRRFPNVLRSINLNHSVCAVGPNAVFLTADHHHSETAWDQYSPYYRLREVDGAWIVGLGVGHRLKVATSLHCVESALWKENVYYGKLFREQVCYQYKTVNGDTGRHCYKRRVGQIYTPKLAKYFERDELIEETIEGLEVYAIRARVLIDKAITLGKQGKTMYVWPIPFPWYFVRRPEPDQS